MATPVDQPNVEFWDSSTNLSSKVNANNQIIIGPTTATPEGFIKYNMVLVRPGSTLNFPQNSEVIIERGSKLIVAGQNYPSIPITLTTTGASWKGIRVKNGGHLYFLGTPCLYDDFTGGVPDLPAYDDDGDLVRDTISNNFKLQKVSDINNVKTFYQASRFDEVDDTIEWIEVEAWTLDETDGGTDDPIHIEISFKNDSNVFTGTLNSSNNVIPGKAPFRREQRDRFLFASLPAWVKAKNIRSISKIKFYKQAGETDGWSCEAVGIRVNDLVVLSREVNQRIDTNNQSYPSYFEVVLKTDGTLNGLEVRVKTMHAPEGGTDDTIHATVHFNGGATLQWEIDRPPSGYFDDFERGDEYAYLLPVTAAIHSKTRSDIAKIVLQKSGTDKWFLQGVWLHADGSAAPVIQNPFVNEDLDGRHVAVSNSWDSGVVYGPAYGGMTVYKSGSTDYAAVTVWYRPERSGKHRLKVKKVSDGSVVADLIRGSSPVLLYELANLVPNTTYQIQLWKINLDGSESLIDDYSSQRQFTTYPPEGTAVTFSFAVGSCWRIGNDTKAGDKDPEVFDTIKNDPTVKFFVHCGDTTYWHDDVLDGSSPDVIQEVLAGQHQFRRHPRVQSMIKKIPIHGVWDDHDFGSNDLVGAAHDEKHLQKKGFLDYWPASKPLDRPGSGLAREDKRFGIMSHFAYGNVDFYLLDDRFYRTDVSGQDTVYSMMDGSTRPAIDRLIQHIQSRPGKIKVLIGGSVFSNDQHGSHGYGKASYDDERDYFFARLRDEIKNNTIKGLIFLSGDIHGHEVNQVKLPRNPTPSTDYRYAIEIVSSPLAENSDGKDEGDLQIELERKARIITIPSSHNWGYARITINSSISQITIEYIREGTGAIMPMEIDESGTTINSKTITLNANNEFLW